MQSTAFCSMRLVKAIFFLGSVDILAQPNQGTGELQKPKITTGQFVEARKDTPKMLDFADKALNQMPFAVAPIIIFSWLFSVDFRRDDHFNALGDEFHDKTLCCITTVGNQRLKVQVNYHIMRLEDVMALTGGQGQAQRIAQAINCHMNFGAKPASAAPQSLFSLSTVFWGSRSAGMSAYNGTVHHPIFHIWVSRKIRQHALPHPVVAPARKALVDTVPMPVFAGQQSPLRPATVNP